MKKQIGYLKHVDFEINLSCLGWDTPKQLSKDIHDAILRNAYCTFPQMWAVFNSDGIFDHPVKNPLTIYLNLGLNDGLEDEPTYSFTLDEVWEEWVGNEQDIMNWKDNPDSCKEAKKVSDALRVLADKIDKQLNSKL